MSDFAVNRLSDQFHSPRSGYRAGPELSESKEKSRIGSLVVKISHYQSNTFKKSQNPTGARLWREFKEGKGKVSTLSLLEVENAVYCSRQIVVARQESAVLVKFYMKWVCEMLLGSLLRTHPGAQRPNRKNSEIPMGNDLVTPESGGRWSFYFTEL